MAGYGWLRRGDVNAFCGLMLDNLAVMIFLLALVGSASADQAAQQGRYTSSFVVSHMIPGTALGVVLGDLVYTWFAFRLARQSGRSDVTAMPLGLDTPSTFAVGPLVLLPALSRGMAVYGLSHEQAMVFGWHVGALVLVCIGIFKTVVAPFGEAVRRWVPRAGLLGSLSAVALVLIAFLPLWQHIATQPLVGMLSLTVILVTLVAHRNLPGHLPGALVAVVVGIVAFHSQNGLSSLFGWPVTHEGGSSAEEVLALPTLLPVFAQDRLWWERVGVEAFTALPIMLPFGLATIIGGIDCTESAAAAGDTYDTRAILLTEGLASIAAGLCGGVIQNTPYIGQPAYKAMGGRAGYTLATALCVGAAGAFGWFTTIFAWLPAAATFPILVFVGLEIASQSFRATPTAHYPALGFAILPALAALVVIPVDMLPHQSSAGLQALHCLANGFIVTSLLWGSSLAALIDGQFRRAALFLAIAAVCGLFGIIHSPLQPAAVALPGDVFAQLPDDPALRIQSPYHWAAAYGLSALLLLLFGMLVPQESGGDDSRGQASGEALAPRGLDSAQRIHGGLTPPRSPDPSSGKGEGAMQRSDQ